MRNGLTGRDRRRVWRGPLFDISFVTGPACGSWGAVASPEVRSRSDGEILAAWSLFPLPGGRVSRLALPDVTLACVDTRAPQIALTAIERCIAQIEFARVVLFTDVAAQNSLPAHIDGVPISIGSVDEYSAFMLRGLATHITTPFVLVVQWDGYVLDATAWDPAFLEYDYIGAPFRSGPQGWLVGNGGFSLRSAKLLAAMQDPSIAISNPEDTCICHDNRVRLERDFGIRFATPDVAARFAFERVEPTGPTFGFHGLFNFHRIMSSDQLHDYLHALPDELACGVDGRDLCRFLIADGQLDLAALIITKRQRLGLLDNRTLRLRAALHKAELQRRVTRLSPAPLSAPPTPTD